MRASPFALAIAVLAPAVFALPMFARRGLAQPHRAAPPAPLTETERARAATIAANSCGSCHGGEMLSQQRLTLAQWQGTVKKMRSWGAVLNDAEADLLARYLAAVAGPDAGPAVAPTVPADAAAAALAREPDGPYGGGDPAAGKDLFELNCLSCHGASGRGASPGVNLVDRPILYRAPEFAERVHKGRGFMKGFPNMADRDIAAILAWLRSNGPVP